MALANQTWEEAPPRHLIVSKELSDGRRSGVFQAVDPVSQRQVALKTATQETHRTAAVIVREAEILSRLDHPNIARLIGLDYANRSAALLTEFVSGSTLDSQLASGLDRATPRLVELITQLCQAVSAVHRAGFVHGDISSRNILVAPDNRLVLIDFGGSRPLGAPSTPARATPAFAAPELFRGAPASIPSDIYSLGVLLSLLVRSETEKTRHAAEAVATPHESRWTLLDIIERATESDPSRRYATVEDVLSAVQQLAAAPPQQTT
jgi:eukaryotic-like serine/threonine-protein kinase